MTCIAWQGIKRFPGPDAVVDREERRAPFPSTTGRVELFHGVAGIGHDDPIKGLVAFENLAEEVLGVRTDIVVEGAVVVSATGFPLK